MDEDKDEYEEVYKEAEEPLFLLFLFKSACLHIMRVREFVCVMC